MSTLNGGPGIVTNGLVLYLDAANPASYVNGSTAWNDLTRNGYNLTLTNGPSYSSNNAGVIAFDGTNDYAIITNANIKDYTTITVSLWMNVSAIEAWETYYSYNSEEGGLTTGWGVRRQSTNNNYQFWAAGVSSIKLYENAQLISTTGFSEGTNTTGSWNLITLCATGITTWSTHNRLTIATRSDSINSSTAMQAGMFSLYSRELTATEIQQNYNATKSRFNLT